MHSSTTATHDAYIHVKLITSGQFHGNRITNQRFGSYFITLCSTPMILVEYFIRCRGTHAIT